MSIAIDSSQCVGCGKCIAVCPGGLIKSNVSGKAFIRWPEDCWGCASCLKECKTGAIAYFLGADIGGQGSRMRIREQDDSYIWIVEKPDGTISSIKVKKRDSNKY